MSSLPAFGNPLVMTLAAFGNLFMAVDVGFETLRPIGVELENTGGFR